MAPLDLKDTRTKSFAVINFFLTFDSCNKGKDFQRTMTLNK